LDHAAMSFPHLAVSSQQALTEHTGESGKSTVSFRKAVAVRHQDIAKMIRVARDVHAALIVWHVVKIAVRLEASTD
jgi:hypothetical protein